MADEPVEELGDLARGTPAARASICAERLGQAVRDLHVPAPQLPQQLHVVVAGHAERRARARPCPSPAAARRAMSGPRSTRSPTKTRLAARRVARRRPAGRRRRARPRSRARSSSVSQLVAAAVHVADDVERPVLVPAVVPERLPLDRRPRRPPPATSSTKTWRKPSRSQAAQRPRAAAPSGWRTTCGPKSRSGRPRLRSWQSSLRQVEDDRDRQAVVLAGQRDERLAGLRLDVGGVDHRQPARAPAACAAMKCSTSKASVGRRLVVLVVGDQPAADVRREHLGRLEVLARERATCPSRTAPIEDDERELGDRRASSCVSAIASNTAICVGGADLRVLRPDRQEARPRSRSARRRRSAQSWNSRARPLEAVVAVAELPGRQRLEAHVVLGVRRRHDDRRRPGALEHARARTRRSRGGSRCSITSTTAAASKPGEPRVAVGERRRGAAGPARAAARRSRSSCSRSRGDLERAMRHVDADDLARTAAPSSSARSSLPSPQPRSSTRFAPLACERRDDRAEPLLVQAAAAPRRASSSASRGLAAPRRGRVLVLDQPRERLARRAPRWCLR